jgi:hypothetical protein
MDGGSVGRAVVTIPLSEYFEASVPPEAARVSLFGGNVNDSTLLFRLSTPKPDFPPIYRSFQKLPAMSRYPGWQGACT